MNLLSDIGAALSKQIAEKAVELFGKFFHSGVRGATALPLPQPFPCASCDTDLIRAKVLTSGSESTLSFDFTCISVPEGRTPFVMIVYQFQKARNLSIYHDCSFAMRFDERGSFSQVYMEVKKDQEDKQRQAFEIGRDGGLKQPFKFDLRDKFDMEALQSAKEICFTVKLTPETVSKAKGSFSISQLVLRK